MPWRGPEYDGEFPSLGWEILEWAERTFRVPDGPLAGQPLRLTDEQAEIVVRFYGLDDRGKFVFRRGTVRRPQGWGKSPLLAVLALAEMCGPTRFDGWDARGEPVGRQPTAPWVQVAAVSEDQTDNTYAALYEMAQESELAGKVLDVGLTRTYLKGEFGRLEPVTSAAGTRQGQRVTFAVLDETHLWLPRNGGHKLARVLRRNAGKMDGRTFESTNAHEPGEDSVAERSWLAAQQGYPGLLYDYHEAPAVEDLRDREAVLSALHIVYGDSVRWVNLERLADEMADPATDPSDARRFYLNQLVSASERPVDIQRWESLACKRDVKDGEYIGLGFDGSISEDSTALYGCTQDGYIFEIAAWERPPDVEGWRVPRLEVHRVIEETFARYRVGCLNADPAKWWTEIEQWELKYGEGVVFEFDTNSTKRFAPACGRFATEVREGLITHDGREGLTAHLAACGRKNVRLTADEDDGRTLFVVIKADTRKIDRAVAAILAREAAAVMPPLEDDRSAYEDRELLVL